MIKLVVVDMDGTLVNDHGELPKNINEKIVQLQAKGIQFAIGSGRQYASLKDSFNDLYQELVFFSDNGTFVFEKDEIVYQNTMKDEHVKAIIKRTEDFDVKLVLSAAQAAHYLIETDPIINQELSKFYRSIQTHASFDDINEPIGKIGILDMSETLELGYLFEDLPELHYVRSAPQWMDIMKRGANKGDGLKHYQELNNISKDETVAIGDYMNDYEMLERASWSFAMENAIDEIKEVARFQAGSNNNQGVIKILDDLLDGSFKSKWKI